jgi:hypothetical protein
LISSRAIRQDHALYPNPAADRGNLGSGDGRLALVDDLSLERRNGLGFDRSQQQQDSADHG